MNLKQIRKLFFGLGLGLLLLWAGFRWGEKQAKEIGPGFSSQNSVTDQVNFNKVDFSIFEKTWQILDESYLENDKLDSLEMVYAATAGVVDSLGDPYTVFLYPEENKRSAEDLQGVFEGIGIELGYVEDRLAVISPLTGMPAIKAGVLAGDFILAIDDQSTEEINILEAVEKIRGERGTVVRLSLEREGLDPFDLDIVRGTVLVESVKWDLLERGGKKLAHLTLNWFGDRTEDEWLEAVDEIVAVCGLRSENCAGVILDLRNNPGGYLDGSVFIAGEFLSSGVVVRQEGAGGETADFTINRQGKLLDFPLAVLINKGSASASEIVAGCLKEFQRAKIVGEQTFGKGTIQESLNFPGGAGLHVTVARWLLPSGVSIDGVGLSPDIEVDEGEFLTDGDQALEAAINYFLANN